jgi:phospholipid/cholesterol/gamma-HCH transport system substrate-binding protein
LETKTSYTMVGFGVIVLSLSLLGSVLWLSSGFDKKLYTTYAVYLNEAVTGLNVDSPVKFNGVPVGSVFKITLNPANPQQVELLLHIDEKTPITSSTFATLISQGITGTTFVGLSAKTSELNPLQKRPEDPYPIIPAKPSILNQLDHVLQKVSENVNLVSQRMNSILDDENIRNFKQSLANIQKLTAVLAKKSNQLTTNLSNASEDISSAMHAGKKAFNKVSGQTLPPATQLFIQLNQVASNLEQLTSDLKQNPSILIRGEKAPKPGPGE